MSGHSTYYLLKENYEKFPSGSILEYNDNQTILFKADFDEQFDNDIQNNCVKIDKYLAHYLQSQKIWLRNEIYSSEIFAKIENLKANDECKFFDGNETQICTILEKRDDDSLCFTVKMKEDDEEQTISATSIFPIDHDIDINIVGEFYLQWSNSGFGSVIKVIGDIPKSYDGKNLDIGPDYKEKCLRITEEEASVIQNVLNRDKIEESKVNENFRNLNEKLDMLEKAKDGSSSKEYQNLFKILNDCYSHKRKLFGMFANQTFINFSIRIFTLTNTSLKENKKAKVYTELCKTCSLTLSILCHIIHKHSTFLNSCALSDDLMNIAKELFEVLNKKQKRITAEEEILVNIIRLYYSILKSNLEFKIPITTIMEECFRTKHDLQIKTGAALCLSHLFDKSCPILGDVYLHLEMVRKESPHELGDFANEIMSALRKTSLLVDNDCILLSQLTKHLTDITKEHKFGSKYNFTIDTHNNLKFLYENISKINKPLLNFYKSSEFISMTHLIVTEFQNLFREQKKLDIKDKIFLDCVMTTLSMVCDLCYFEFGRIQFIKNITDNATFMFALKDIFKTLMKDFKPRSLEAQFLENVVFIFCNILKSRISPCLDDIYSKIYNCFNLQNINNQTKMAAALCMSSIECPNSDLKKNIKIYLENILTEDSSYHIYGFIRTEILSGLAQISLKKKPSKASDKDEAEFKEMNSSSQTIGIIRNSLESIIKWQEKSVKDSFNDLLIFHENLKKESGKLIDTELCINTLVSVLNRCSQTLSNDKTISSPEGQADLENINKFITIYHVFCSIKPDMIEEMSSKTEVLYKLNNVFAMLVKKTDASTMSTEQSDFIVNIMLIYWNILKSNLSIDESVFLTLKDCIKKYQTKDKIKLASSICLTFNPNRETAILNNIKLYFENLYGALSTPDLHGFQRSEIQMCYGYILLENKNRGMERSSKVEYRTCLERPFSVEYITHRKSSDFDHGYISLSGSETFIKESSDDSIDSKLSFENILPFTLECSKYLHQVPVSLVKRALLINNTELLRNVIKNVKSDIDLSENRDIFDRCYKDHNLFVELLAKANVPQNKYQYLIDLLSSVSDISKMKVICKKLEIKHLSSEHNQQLLGRAFCYAKQNQFEEFKVIIETCKDCDDFLKMTKEENATETFLTKMLQELNVKQMDSIWKIKKFNMNRANESGKPPIVIAAGSPVNLPWFVKNVNESIIAKSDWEKALDIVNDIDNKNERKAMYKILVNCNPQ